MSDEPLIPTRRGFAAVIAGLPLFGARINAIGNAGLTDHTDDSATVMEIGVFAIAHTREIPGSRSMVRTSGYATTGIGPADYVCDARATDDLLARFPNLVFRSANGRIFRFSGAIVYTIQSGAVGIAGINDQPAIQQALGYACATGIQSVTCSHAAYEMWCPIRAPKLGGYDASGIPMVISQNLHFSGAAGGTTFSLKNSNGGPKTVITQQGPTIYPDPSANYAWQGGGIYVKPAGAKMEWVVLTDVHVDGGLPYAPANYERPSAAERAMLNLTDKGFRIQDSIVDRVKLERCSFRHFGGEIYYIGGSGVLAQDIQDCVFEGSPQCAMNPGSLASIYFRNVKAGRSFQNEILGGTGGSMTGCRFYDLYSMFVSGGPDPAFKYNYAYPVRRTDLSPPFVDLSLSRFERIGTVTLTSFCIGDIVAVDAPISLSDTGRLSDVNLRIQAWCDLKTNYEAFSISGPANTTTQVSGAPDGIYVETPRNIRVEIICHRTGLAMSNGRAIKIAMRYYGGLIDQSCQFIIDGEMQSFFDGTFDARGFAFPRIDIRNTARPLSKCGSTYGTDPSADFTLNLTPGVIAVDVQASGTFTMTATLNNPLAPGQRVKIVNNSPLGRAIHVPASPGGTISLSGDRILDGQGSYLELEQQPHGGMIETGFSTQRPPMAPGQNRSAAGRSRSPKG